MNSLDSVPDRSKWFECLDFDFPSLPLARFLINCWCSRDCHSAKLHSSRLANRRKAEKNEEKIWLQSAEFNSYLHRMCGVRSGTLCAARGAHSEKWWSWRTKHSHYANTQIKDVCHHSECYEIKERWRKTSNRQNGMHFSLSRLIMLLVRNGYYVLVIWQAVILCLLFIVKLPIVSIECPALLLWLRALEQHELQVVRLIDFPIVSTVRIIPNRNGVLQLQPERSPRERAFITDVINNKYCYVAYMRLMNVF